MRAHDEARARNHELAQLIGWAFHSPSKMPKFKSTDGRAAPARSGPREDEAGVRAFFIGLATRGQP